jgi:hypothetical protein
LATVEENDAHSRLIATNWHLGVKKIRNLKRK